jgi:hypothetical protein
MKTELTTGGDPLRWPRDILYPLKATEKFNTASVLNFNETVSNSDRRLTVNNESEGTEK